MSRLESLLARGEAEHMLDLMFRDVVKMSEDEIAAVKAAPSWPARIAAAHTVPREIRAFGAQAFDPAQADKVAVPVLLLVGSDSPDDVKADPDVVAAALPDARIGVLDGQMHMAHLTDPQSFVDRVVAFLRE
jgi:pimeloyl-ACP methyl ester carboxylesterase